MAVKQLRWDGSDQAAATLLIEDFTKEVRRVIARCAESAESARSPEPRAAWVYPPGFLQQCQCGRELAAVVPHMWRRFRC